MDEGTLRWTESVQHCFITVDGVLQFTGTVRGVRGFLQEFASRGSFAPGHPNNSAGKFCCSEGRLWSARVVNAIVCGPMWTSSLGII